MLYQADVVAAPGAHAIASQWSLEPEEDPSVRDFAERLVHETLGDLPRIDSLISQASHNWRIDRIGAVDRNILRLAIGEMIHDASTPPAVVIDEAIEIAKTYGESESHQFVNGILEGVRRRLGAESGVPAPESREP